MLKCIEHTQITKIQHLVTIDLRNQCFFVNICYSKKQSDLDTLNKSYIYMMCIIYKYFHMFIVLIPHIHVYIYIYIYIQMIMLIYIYI